MDQSETDILKTIFGKLIAMVEFWLQKKDCLSQKVNSCMIKRLLQWMKTPKKINFNGWQFLNGLISMYDNF